MQFVVKEFSELTREELYALLRLRSAVFVVEQDCVYQDIDNKDQNAWHVLGFDSDELVAYTRLFRGGDYFELPAIGRVVVAESHRRKDLGKQLMEVSLAYIEKFFGTDKVELSAQTYLNKFYMDLGFKPIGAEYLEDGIPHIKMRRT